MNLHLLIASGLAVTLAFVHAFLGELLIFSKIRRGAVNVELAKRQIGILWASWHLVTVFGLAMGAILLRMAKPVSHQLLHAFIAQVIFISMIIAALLVLYGTRGKHPGWIVLFIISLLIWISGVAF